ncbi:serine/threonine-protein kinase-like protein At3g51990 [Impatiens glandulifera]|uniref:serine/threonine-protein kinase-like protein At3g51990 n=1 Tax=Impatiens glandulifera TaxID=253017 RepID=UPI001FB133F9|nr:serine/threonine-protein kinase-like protein At3g51990 [Impatiens glandulifera]
MGYLSCKAESSVATIDQSQKKPIKIKEFQYSDLENATNGFSDQKLLGKGSHGLVYKGVLSSGRLVAVKKSTLINRPPSSPYSNNEVDNEIEILSQLQSPCLVNLVGFTASPASNRLLVVEFMSNGTLYDVLHSSSRQPPNWGRRIRFALQTAKAIHGLHSLNPPVIHRDIKSANVLIDRSFNARLGDFGLALRCGGDDYYSTPPAGTIGYLDPYYVTPDNLSTKIDVFSYGILLLEIISGRKAIDVGYSPPSIVDWAIPLIRRGRIVDVYDPRIEPPKDPRVRKHLAVIAAKCVRSCKERRPSMKEIVESIGELSKSIPLHSWNGISKPCAMIDTIGGGNSGRWNSKPSSSGNQFRRVYSDLGLRTNLMELMTGNQEEEDGENLAGKVHSCRRSSRRSLKPPMEEGE